MLNVILLFVILILASVSDVRHRSIPMYIIYFGYGVACITLLVSLYDTSLDVMYIASCVVGVILGGIFILLGRYMTLLGSGDGHIIIIASCIIPWWNDTPVVIFGIMAGCIMALLYNVVVNVIRNLQHMISHRAPVKFDIDFFMTHYKVRNEKFTISYDKRYAGVYADADGTIKSDGMDIFEDASSYGQRVYNTIPMIPYIGGGILLGLLVGF